MSNPVFAITRVSREQFARRWRGSTGAHNPYGLSFGVATCYHLSALFRPAFILLHLTLQWRLMLDVMLASDNNILLCVFISRDISHFCCLNLNIYKHGRVPFSFSFFFSRRHVVWLCGNIFLSCFILLFRVIKFNLRLPDRWFLF